MFEPPCDLCPYAYSYCNRLDCVFAGYSPGNEPDEHMAESLDDGNE